MRRLLRAYAKAEMRRQGYTKVNRIMASRWEEFLTTFTPPVRRRKTARPKYR